MNNRDNLFDPISSLQSAVIYADGGSRGNPGPAAAGFVVNGLAFGEFLGIRTNNYAEYTAAISGLKKLKSMIGSTRSKKTNVQLYMDSQLVVRQMNRQYKIEHPDLQMLFLQLWNLTLDFKSVSFIHIPREQNKAADAAVNDTLDRHRRN